MSKFLRLPVLLLATVALIGCEEKRLDVCEQAAAAGSSLELGTGANTFESLQDGDDVIAVWGPQGGHHMWVGLRATGIDPGDGILLDTAPVVTWDAWAGDTHIGSGSLHQDLLAEDDTYVTYGQMMGLSYSLLEPHLDPETNETEIRIVASLSDACGTNLSDERFVMLQI